MGVTFEDWAALAGDSPTSRTEWAAVVGAWSEPHRAYHSLAHLAAVLGLVEQLTADADPSALDPTAIALAGWYHDVAYDPQRTDNEQLSAERARIGLVGLVPAETVEEVARLVLLTVTHDPADDDVNGAVLCDADLAVLASPPEAYAGYASAVRQEYAHLDDEAFTAGRTAVLEGLLERPALYRLPRAAQLWTEQARANLSAELTLLRSRAPS